jgi:hypothetical protein
MHARSQLQVLLLDSNALLFQPPAVFFDKLTGNAAAPIYLFRDYQACFSSLSRRYVTPHCAVTLLLCACMVVVWCCLRLRLRFESLGSRGRS